ncbi:MAG TPA: glutamate synthase subunit beta, partial [Phycisphaerae bacterium]|nr:glutamate synthase subunit beta [Phycisphaerae bacterium]
KNPQYRDIPSRVKDYFEIPLPLSEEDILIQAARCMDCGVPFCHAVGCPLHNRIPEFNDLVYSGRWKEACDVLHSTNNFPEITGRICPALCEAACTINIAGENAEPVTIRHIECQVAERGWKEGWIVPQPAEKKSGRKVAIVGSGPAGLAAAQQLARCGHDVVVFEKDNNVGGLLRYGIPNFKLEKEILDRRVKQLEAEGVEFRTGVTVGEDISMGYIQKFSDAILLTMGAGEPRDLAVDGRGLENVHFALEYLSQQIRRMENSLDKDEKLISANGKNVIVIGGGDTGSDCVGTARRQGAKSIWQLEILPKPPADYNPETPWPNYPRILRTSTSHEEGCERRWSVTTKKLVGSGVKVNKIICCEVDWINKNGKWEMKEIPNSTFELDADLVLLAMGFLHVAHKGVVDAFGLKTDSRGNLAINNYQTSRAGIFAAGDTTRGASLVVWAIQEGRNAAEAIDSYLKSL